MALDTIVRIAGGEGSSDDIDVDLTPALREGRGHAVVVVEPRDNNKHLLKSARRWRGNVFAWLQVTDIGLDATVDAEECVAWTTALEEGEPLAGVELTMLPAGETATTGADGLATFAVSPASHSQDGRNLLVARRGEDSAFLPDAGFSYGPVADREGLVWYVTDDRGMYRPGETAHVKGWLRVCGGGKRGDLSLPEAADWKVRYDVSDSQQNEVGKGLARLSRLGGFDFAVELPEAMNLGEATIRLKAHGPKLLSETAREHWHRLRVEEFRRPEFEVSTIASGGSGSGEAPGPYVVGDAAAVTVRASYYAGGGLPDTDVRWSVTAREGSYTPPGRSGFTFGTWRAWWIDFVGRSSSSDDEKREILTGTTNTAGEHRIGIDFLSVEPPRPAVVRAEAVVTDVNRQVCSASTELLVHPALLYVGLRVPRPFVHSGEPLTCEAVVCDLDGAAVPGRTVVVELARCDTRREGGTCTEIHVPVEMREVESLDHAVECSFDIADGGTYRLRATVLDAEGRRGQSELTVWAAGERMLHDRSVEEGKLVIIPDRREYRVGDSAELLVQAPFHPAHGLLTVRRSGVVHSEAFSVQGPTHTLEVDLTEEHIPNVWVRIDLVGRAPASGEPDDPPAAPAFASGTLELAVPPRTRTLAVDIAPRDAELEPAGETLVELAVGDARGEPVAGAEVLVAVVDEAVLALSAWELLDPLAIFYASRHDGAIDHRLRSQLLVPDEPCLRSPAVAGGGGGGAQIQMAVMRAERFGGALEMDYFLEDAGIEGGSGDEPIAVRSDFAALALFAPAVITGADGRAQVDVRLPHNLTRYRVIAVAVAGERQFGGAES